MIIEKSKRNKVTRALELPIGVGLKASDENIDTASKSADIFRVKPREELERWFEIPRQLLDAIGVLGRIPNINQSSNQTQDGQRATQEDYRIDNLEPRSDDPAIQIPRGSLNQPSPQDSIGKMMMKAAGIQSNSSSDTRPRIAQTNETEPMQTRPKFVGEPTLDDEIAKNEAYINALKINPVENKNSRFKGFLRSLGYGLSAFGQGKIDNWSDFARAGGQTLGTGLYGLFDKKLDEKFERQKEIAKTEAETQRLYGRDEILRKKIADRVAKAKQEAETEWLKKRPDIESQKIDQRAKDARIRVVASVFNRSDEFDPSDPANTDTVEMMRELGLPVIAKKRGQKLQYIQDPKTGAWSVIAGDATTGAAASSQITTQDGDQLVTTSREKFQQDWKTAENDKQREAMLEKAAADRATRLQIAEQRSEEAKKKGEWKNDSYFREIDNQLSDTWGELSQLQSEISKRKSGGEEIPDWMRQRQSSLSKEARRLELIIAKEQDRMRKAGNVPMPENQQNPTQNIGMPRKNLPELMKRKGFKTEQEAIDWLTSQGITVF